MISKQLWSPDTCKCELEQTFDYDTKPATLVSSLIVKPCDEHFNADNDVIIKENTDKNKLIAEIVKLHSDIKPEKQIKLISNNQDKRKRINGKIISNS